MPALATIKFFRQGATVKVAATIPYVDPEDPNPPPPTPITVWNLGSLQVNDVLQIDSSVSSTLIVAGLDDQDPDNPKVLVYNTSVQAGLGAAVGKRLLRKTNSAIVYSTPTGAVAGSPPPTDTLTTDANTGRASGYVSAYRYDYTVTGSGLPTTVCVDAVGSFVMRT